MIMPTIKYPKIITDSNNNAVNTDLKVELTVEQLYDIMHHTHNVNDLVGLSDGGDLSESDKLIIQQLNIKIDNMQKTVDQQNTNISQIKESIENIQNNINDILKYIEEDIQSADIS